MSAVTHEMQIGASEVIEAEGEPESLSIVSEFVLFLRENKKWWLVPMIAMSGLLGSVMVLSATPLGPFIYTLF